MNARRTRTCTMRLLPYFLTWLIAQAEEILCDGISCRGYNHAPQHVYEENVDMEAKVDDDCEGVSCRYNPAPKEADVSGVDDNLFRHDLCALDKNGLFGSNQAESQSVDYFYQVETEPATTTADINELLGKIETSISRTILPALFPDQCAPTSMSRKRQHREPQQPLEVMGVSTTPVDKVLNDVPCRGELTSDADDCYVIDGIMTFYSHSEIDESRLDTIRNIIRTAMNIGDYDRVHPSIVQVSYREDLGKDANETDDRTTPVDDDSLPAWSIVLVGIGSLLILLGVFFIVRKRHQRNQQERGLTGNFPTEEYTELHIVINSRNQQTGEFPTVSQQSAYDVGAVT